MELVVDAGTIEVDVTTHDLAVECYVASQNLTLPAGRWQVSLAFTSTPARTAGPTTRVLIDQTLASPGAINIPVTRHWVYRDVEQGEKGELQVRLDIHLRDGTVWDAYDHVYAVEPVPAAVPATNQRRGGDINFIPTRRTQASFNWAFAEHASLGIDIVRVSFGGLWLWYGMDWTAGMSSTPPADISVFNSEAADIFDDYLDAATTAGFQVFAQTQMLSVPSWGATHNDVLAGGVYYGPASQTTIDGFMPAYLNRFGDRLSAVGIGNEPNHSAHLYPADHVGPLQSRFYTKVKATHPAIDVVMGEIAFGDTAYVTTMLANGATGKYDAVSIHPYSISFDHPGYATGLVLDPRRATDLNSNWAQYKQYGLPVSIAEFDKLLTSNGDTTSKLWITEFGFANARKPAAVGMRLTEEQVMDRLRVEILQAQAASRVDVVMPFRIDANKSDEDPFNWIGNFGAFDQYQRAKPRLATYLDLWG